MSDEFSTAHSRGIYFGAKSAQENVLAKRVKKILLYMMTNSVDLPVD